MTDQSWAILIGTGVVVLLRVIDFFFPKGKWFGWGGNVKEDIEKQHEEDAIDDAKTDVKRRKKDRIDDSERRERDWRIGDEQ